MKSVAITIAGLKNLAEMVTLLALTVTILFGNVSKDFRAETR